ncbi:MAG: pyridoxamine 5'-phosphate oxidase [Ignavibacteriae bacterium HGW-Ignavibacteriae-4]|jgi:pyridoxamine 5'-phosphate oxidase|nr:MAG: pyridoxamine 5'-phosphate oxidase [Ignavibacteriae bacterium HGW-Ignavibacteriae-4]
MIENLSEIRQEYTKFSLDIKDVNSSPFHQFKDWFQVAIKSDLFYDPTAFNLSTCGLDMMPSSRIVLLKSFDENGFQFFTNYSSEKGNNLEENPNASMLFYWDKLERQVRISGSVEKLSAIDSDNYFNSRPYESRIGAIASNQSSPLISKHNLEARLFELKALYPENPPRPENWGGYNVKPISFEFWQGRESRLHDRIKYRLNNHNWEIERLYP